MSTLTPPISFAELRFICTRAAIGAGAPFGIGEDFAETAHAIAAMGFDAARTIYPSLKKLADSRSCSDIRMENNDGLLVFQAGQHATSLSSVFAGPALCDHLAVAGMGGYARLENVDCPLLAVAGLGSITSKQISCRVTWLTPGGFSVSLLFKNGHIVSIKAPDMLAVIASEATDVHVDYTGDPPDEEGNPLFEEQHFERARKRALTEGLEMDATDWAAIHAYFKRCLVPSSEQSVATGAGAGLVDTD